MTGIDELEKIADPARRAKEIGDRLDQIPVFQTRLRKMRQAAVLEMKASGMTYAAIGTTIGLHRNRVQQIAEGRTAGGQGGDKAREAEAAKATKPRVSRKKSA